MKRENCYYYIEYPDMGGNIPCCAKYTVLGKCPCDNCNDFLEGSDAEKIIEAYLKKDLISISVIEDIKREFSPLYGYGATEIWKIIDEHIDEYIKEYTNE